ncbi:hypothetical protein KHQ88_00875 [Mycoplasmatota bacterium]|nr:hypothetical protein KHQ88_00875 [Mycoplasmatota bacterium]
MRNNSKVDMIIFTIMFIFYLGAAVVSSNYLWFSLVLLITLALFYLQDLFTKKNINGNILRVFPILFVGLFIFATQMTKPLIVNNPQEITVYIDEQTNNERVRVDYGIYHSVTIIRMSRSLSQVDLLETSSGYELNTPLNPDLEIYTWIYILLGIPLVINSIIGFLNQTVSKRTDTYRRDSVMKVILSSGDRFSSHNPKSNHVQLHESFLQETAKKEMVNERQREEKVYDNKSVKKKDE